MGLFLTSTEEVIGQWKEHFEELLNPTNPLSGAEAELEEDGGSTLISLEGVTEVVKNSTVTKPQGLMRSVQKC